MGTAIRPWALCVSLALLSCGPSQPRLGGAAQAQEHKITICHVPQGDDPPAEIEVAGRAAEQHLAQHPADRYGPCTLPAQLAASLSGGADCAGFAAGCDLCDFSSAALRVETTNTGGLTAFNTSVTVALEGPATFSVPSSGGGCSLAPADHVTVWSDTCSVGHLEPDETVRIDQPVLFDAPGTPEAPSVFLLTVTTQADGITPLVTAANLCIAG